MAFDEELYKKVLTTTNAHIATNDDGIFTVSETKMKTFLEENTSISDTEKAQIYSNFLTNIATASLQQTLSNAKEIALEQSFKDAQIASMEAETTREGSLANANIANMAGELAIKRVQSDKDLLVKDAQIASSNAETGLRQAEIMLRGAEVQLEKAKTRLTDKQIDLESEKVDLMREELELKKAMSDIEKEKLELNKNESGAKIEALDAETRLKDQQAGAVSVSLSTNLDIEKEKRQTEKEVATIYATGKGIK